MRGPVQLGDRSTGRQFPVVRLVGVGGDLNRLAVRGARSSLALAAHSREGENDDRSEDAEHNDDDEQFNQSEAAFLASLMPALLNLAITLKHTLYRLSWLGLPSPSLCHWKEVPGLGPLFATMPFPGDSHGIRLSDHLFKQISTVLTLGIHV